MKKRIVLICRDEDNSLERLLLYIQRVSAIGHSFPVEVDPEEREFRSRFYVDGDGADKILSIEVEKIP